IVPRSALTDSGRLRIAPPPEERPPVAREQGDPDRVGRQLAAGMPRRASIPTARGDADPSNETTDDSGGTSLDLPAVAGPARPRTSIMSGRAQEAVQAAAASRTIVLLAGDGEEI